MMMDNGIHYVDLGVSGGVWGLEEGYNLMVGGEVQPVDHIRPILETLAPAYDKGWGHVGAMDAGHFVKMVHNGIAYGLMRPYAESFELMHADNGFDLDLHQIKEAIDQNIRTLVIALSRMDRLVSRQNDSYGAKLPAVLGHEFGGHEVEKERATG